MRHQRGPACEFPDVDHPEELDAFLTTHPEITHAFLWTGKGNLDFRSQPGRMTDPAFPSRTQRALLRASDMCLTCGPGEHIAKVKKNEVLEGRHVYISSESVPRGDKMQYESFVYFLPRGSTHEHPALAGFVYDEDYLRNSFFPQALKEVLPDQNAERSVPSSALDHDSEGKRSDSFGCFASLGWGRARGGARASVVFSRA